MREDGHQLLLQQLPAVGHVLNSEEAEPLLSSYPRALVTDAVRIAIQRYRQLILAGEAIAVPTIPQVLDDARIIIESELIPRMPLVINATGIIVHTGLGRSLLSERATQRLVEVARQACALEVELDTGERGFRDTRLSKILQLLTGAEDATVVNNNAAAVLISLNTLAEGREVIVSRGELVEIGGSFRIPEVMAKSGAKLVEVGTTNKTRLSDYEHAITENTALLLKVHRSNFRIVGFTAEVTLEELVELGGRYGIPVMEDLGSGALVDVRQFGLRYEPLVQESIAVGADLVTFSGDKLLGGPQAGVIVGKRKYIERIRKNPLYRAIRVDKLTIAGLEGTLISYLEQERAIREIPTLKLIAESERDVRKRALRLRRMLRSLMEAGIKIEVRRDASQVGGGALPTEDIPTWVVVVQPAQISVAEVAKRLRMGTPSVFCRIQQNELLFDMRTVLPAQVRMLARAIEHAVRLTTEGCHSGD